MTTKGKQDKIKRGEHIVEKENQGKIREIRE